MMIELTHIPDHGHVPVLELASKSVLITVDVREPGFRVNIGLELYVDLIFILDVGSHVGLWHPSHASRKSPVPVALGASHLICLSKNKLGVGNRDFEYEIHASALDPGCIIAAMQTIQ